MSETCWDLLSPVLATAGFLAVNVILLSWVRSKTPPPRRRDPPPRAPASSAASDSEGPDASNGLDVSDVLQWEFEYARTTASEAMQDRHTMVNFYLLVTGIIGSGVVAVVSGEALPNRAGTALLWLLCGVGWLYFLKIVKLRAAWYDSVQAMGWIKKFYIEHGRVENDSLGRAFLFNPDTIPPPNGRWTVFAYSARLVAFLNSAALVGGGVLWNPDAIQWILVPIGLGGLGLVFFHFHVKLYLSLLTLEDDAGMGEAGASGGKAQSRPAEEARRRRVDSPISDSA